MTRATAHEESIAPGMRDKEIYREENAEKDTPNDTCG